MSPDTTAARSIVTSRLPDRVPVEEYYACPVTALVRRLGARWVLVVLAVLAERPHRFNELDRRIEGVSPRMLTRTLRILEHDDLIQRTELPGAAAGVEYTLTARGLALLTPLSALADWGTTQ